MSSTGQGEEIIATTIKVGSGILKDNGEPTSFPDECGIIRTPGGKSETITLTYAGKFSVIENKTVPETDDEIASFQPLQLVREGLVHEGNPEISNNELELAPNAATAFHLDALLGFLTVPYIDVGAKEAIEAPVELSDGYSRGVLLQLRQPTPVQFLIKSTNPNTGGEYWSGRLPIANLGVEYSLPVPRPSAFGDQNFSLSLEPSGALSSVQYASDAGTNPVIGSLGAFSDLISGSSAADQAARYKSEADLIVQQQRLVRCEIKPDDCT